MGRQTLPDLANADYRTMARNIDYDASWLICDCR